MISRISRHCERSEAIPLSGDEIASAIKLPRNDTNRELLKLNNLDRYDSALAIIHILSTPLESANPANAEPIRT